MGSIWCVAPESVTKDLTFVDAEGNSHPFWIRIKKRLSVGESRRMQTAGWQGVTGMGRARPGQEQSAEIKIDWKASTFARTSEYLQDWSLTDDRNVKLAITRDVLESLHEELYAVIDAAVTAHVNEMEEEKKAQAGNSAPSPTSA